MSGRNRRVCGYFAKGLCRVQSDRYGNPARCNPRLCEHYTPHPFKDEPFPGGW